MADKGSFALLFRSLSIDVISKASAETRNERIRRLSAMESPRSLLLIVLFPLWCLAAFDDSVSRSYMLPLSSAAYSNDPQKCVTNALGGGQVC